MYSIIVLSSSNKLQSKSGTFQERQEKAREMLTKVLEVFPSDVEVLIDLAQLLEGIDPQV